MRTVSVYVGIAAVILAVGAAVRCVNDDLGKAAALQDAGDYRGARPLYRRAVRRSPGLFAARYGLGMTWCAEGIFRSRLGIDARRQWYRAIYHMNLALRGAADTVEAARARDMLSVLYFNLGTYHKGAGRRDAAIAQLERAVSCDSSLLKGFNLLGALYHERGDLESAMRCYRRAVRVRPDYAMAHFNLGAAEWARGNYEQAALHFAEADSLAPGTTYFRQWLARASRRAGETD